MYWVIGILGLILGAAPWLFGYVDNTVALWTSLVVGAATIIVSWIEGVHKGREQWEYWTAAILGVVAILAPFVLGFNNYASAMWSSISVGILIAIFAVTRLGTGDWRT